MLISSEEVKFLTTLVLFWPLPYELFPYQDPHSLVVVVVVVLVTQLCPTLQPHALQPARLLCPWDSPGKNTGVSYHSLLQEIFPRQGSNPGLLHCRQILYCLLCLPVLQMRELRLREARNHAAVTQLGNDGTGPLPCSLQSQVLMLYSSSTLLIS